MNDSDICPENAEPRPEGGGGGRGSWLERGRNTHQEEYPTTDRIHGIRGIVNYSRPRSFAWASAALSLATLRAWSLSLAHVITVYHPSPWWAVCRVMLPSRGGFDSMTMGACFRYRKTVC